MTCIKTLCYAKIFVLDSEMCDVLWLSDEQCVVNLNIPSKCDVNLMWIIWCNLFAMILDEGQTTVCYMGSTLGWPYRLGVKLSVIIERQLNLIIGSNRRRSWQYCSRLGNIYVKPIKGDNVLVTLTPSYIRWVGSLMIGIWSYRSHVPSTSNTSTNIEHKGYYFMRAWTYIKSLFHVLPS
jgi:hypothetical protein